MQLLSKTNINFISKQKVMGLLSIALIISGIVSLIIKGGPFLSIDFTGGTVINFIVKKDSYNPEFDLRAYLKENLDQNVSLVEMKSKDGFQSLVITTQFLKDESLLTIFPICLFTNGSPPNILNS